MAKTIHGIFFPENGPAFLREDVNGYSYVNLEKRPDGRFDEVLYEPVGGAPINQRGEDCEFYVRIMKERSRKNADQAIADAHARIEERRWAVIRKGLRDDS